MNKRTGETTPLYKKHGTYIMKVRVLSPGTVAAKSAKPGAIAAFGDDVSGKSRAAGFPRPALL